MKHAPWIILAVLLAAPLALAATYAREFLAVDAALDAGASYDYRDGRADFTQSHPYIPFSSRHGTLHAVSRWSMLGAVCFAVAVVVRRVKKNAAEPTGST
jgi:hypothetical protein